MVKFSAGLLRSNLYQVVKPPGAQANERRYSLVYFSRPKETVPRRLNGRLIDLLVGRARGWPHRQGAVWLTRSPRTGRRRSS
ncbi:hypothetical protein CALVIDRAFT_188531 [Calocera viscosa TUFC12733]|uniref:Uncharacterized protein n=1 Tax=Calocera viscosa (strain TUFC12733) TaxID=1330018 RepID=A0A167KVP4_CALVF|nr:hypothetical protein CALVIDRAFT_188531 [Calocera viscosa TUFC12733]